MMNSTMAASSPTRLAIECDTLVGACSDKALCSSNFHHPLDRPNPLVGFGMSSNTGPLVNRPHLDFAVHGGAEQIFASMTPVQRGDPRAMSGEVGDLLSGMRVVEADHSGIASCG